jgi:plastocyanin
VLLFTASGLPLAVAGTAPAEAAASAASGAPRPSLALDGRSFAGTWPAPGGAGEMAFASLGAGSAVTTTVIQYPVDGNMYAPAVVNINTGDVVEWEAAPGSGMSFGYHPLVSDDDLWPEQGTTPGTETETSFSYRFARPGTYCFHCALHGAAGECGRVGMSGEVIVSGSPITLTYVFLPAVLH